MTEKLQKASRTKRRIKIGIDVGGTFTHAVAIDAASLKLIGQAMVPTTHAAKEGVAGGVVASMRELMRSARILPAEVTLIAHSTTQATNALLEGDVAPVGIIGMSTSADAWRARGQTNIGRLELAPGKFLRTGHRFLDITAGLDEKALRQAVKELRAEGAEVFAVSAAFAVDHPDPEQRAAEMIRSMGFLVTAGSEISQLYGLRVRTRTAVINASMLPTMLQTANLTEASVRKAGIKTPLMIMRSDGGIMSIEEVRRRPILTMLSGPAAGVAAALMYARVSDGLFLEVGGTSTDISIIRNGRPMIRAAEVGGHKLYVRTLDIRTVGIGGGSMVRMHGSSIKDVGPRSAHIANLRYPSFSPGVDFSGATLVPVKPRPTDPDDYAALKLTDGEGAAFALTTTDAANILGIPSGYAHGNGETIASLDRMILGRLGRAAALVATEILDKAADKIKAVVNQFVSEYKLDPSLLTLVGGGGGAEVIVPHVAKRMSLLHTIAGHAEVISAIGVALGMIRDTIERSIVNPTEADILRIRSEAEASVLRMGASPDSVDVRVEVDTRQKRVLATAMGVPDLTVRGHRRIAVDDAALLESARHSFGTLEGLCTEAGSTGYYRVYTATQTRKKLFGLLHERRHAVRVVDRDGIIRLKVADGVVIQSANSTLFSDLGLRMEDMTVYGDAGGLLPDVFVLIRHRLIDLCGLVSRDQRLAVLRAETERCLPNDPSVIILTKKD